MFLSSIIIVLSAAHALRYGEYARVVEDTRREMQGHLPAYFMPRKFTLPVYCICIERNRALRTAGAKLKSHPIKCINLDDICICFFFFRGK